MISALNFKIGGGGGSCADASVQNSDATYSTTVASGGSLTLPNITLTEGDATTTTYPSAKNLVCKPFPVGATLMKTNQTTSFRTGDDGDIEAGRSTNFTTLASNNPFGNTNRFTDELGGQTYTNNIVIDWSTYNGSTVLGWRRTTNGVDINWDNSIDGALAVSIGTYTSGWRLPNVTELFSLLNFGLAIPFNYAPFNLSTNTIIFWSGTNTSTQGWKVHNSTTGVSLALKTTTANYRYIPCRVFTVSGTTLT